MSFLNIFRKQKLLAQEEPFNSRKRKNLNVEVMWTEITILRRSIWKKMEQEDWEKKIRREASEGVVI